MPLLAAGQLIARGHLVCAGQLLHRVLVTLGAQQQRRHHSGDGCDDQHIDRLGQRPTDHCPNVAPEDHEDRDQRADVQQRVQQDAGVVNPQNGLKEHQMSR